MLKRSLIVGASSGMGAQLARVLVTRGHHVALVARRKDKLEQLQAELRSAHPDRSVLVYPHDARDFEEVDELFARIVSELDGLDVVVYAAGVMPAVEPEEFDTAKDALIVDVNTRGAMAWLNPAARRFGAMGAGTIVGISSVAGDRGRIGSPAYCASKAAFTTYLESLRNRLARKGVSVLTIKPGPVRTPMTEGLDKLPMLIDVDVAAEAIFVAIAGGGSGTRYVPRQWGPIMTVLRHIPSVVFRRLNI